jgi:peptide/nickel transport system permease protein
MLGRYLVKRVATTLVIFFVILNFQFLFFWVINPISPVQWVLNPNFTPEVAETLARNYGIDQPLYVQYYKYLGNMLTMNLGVSFRTQRPVIQSLIDYLPYTLSLVLTAMIIQVIIGIAVGLYAVSKRGKLIDIVATGSGLLMYATPSFLVLLLFRYVFAEELHWFPVIGTIASSTTDLVSYLGEYMYRMALPLITLVCIGFGSWAFYTRNLSMDVLTQDYILTARAKGTDGRKLMLKHVLPAILPPVVTRIMISFPQIIFGSIVTEYIFTWKGIGWWFLNSIWSGDYPSAQALFYIYTILLLVGNLLADVLYGFIDPRVRVGTRR